MIDTLEAIRLLNLIVTNSVHFLKKVIVASKYTSMPSGKEVNQAEVKYNALFWPVVAFGLTLGLWNSILKSFDVGAWKWFDYHPLAMSLGMVVLAALAAMKKRIGGKGPTVMHGYMANAGVALGGFGLYVIYSNKEMLKKPHFTTLHGKLGLGAFVAFAMLGLVGGIALHPDFGVAKQNQLIRKAHKFGGRAALLTAWGAAVTGFTKMEASPVLQGGVVLGMALLSYFVML